MEIDRPTLPGVYYCTVVVDVVWPQPPRQVLSQTWTEDSGPGTLDLPIKVKLFVLFCAAGLASRRAGAGPLLGKGSPKQWSSGCQGQDWKVQ